MNRRPYEGHTFAVIFRDWRHPKRIAVSRLDDGNALKRNLDDTKSELETIKIRCGYLVKWLGRTSDFCALTLVLDDHRMRNFVPVVCEVKIHSRWAIEHEVKYVPRMHLAGFKVEADLASAVKETLGRQRRVRPLYLPTYAPWLNNIEKLWRFVRQRVTHAHPCCDDFNIFCEQVLSAFQSLSGGSPEIRRYSGLERLIS